MNVHTVLNKLANQRYGYGAGAISSPQMDNLPPPQMAQGPQFMARGGIVKKPTLAVIGEDGPEAVIPLGKKKKDKKNAKKVAINILEKKAMNNMLPMRPSSSSEYDDKHMLMKCLKAIENMAKEMQEEVACGCDMPSWVEYKIYKAKDALLSAIGHTYSKPKAKDIIMKVL